MGFAIVVFAVGIGGKTFRIGWRYKKTGLGFEKYVRVF